MKAEGYTVYCAATGEEALSYFEKQDVRLVILDIMLPGIDGFAVCRKIREKNNTPVLLLVLRWIKTTSLMDLF